MGKKICNNMFEKGLSTKKMYNMRVQVNFYLGQNEDNSLRGIISGVSEKLKRQRESQYICDFW